MHTMASTENDVTCLLCEDLSHWIEDWIFRARQNFVLASKALPSPIGKCLVCGKVVKSTDVATASGMGVLMCSRCKQCYYCSEKCQLGDWNKGHKDACFSCEQTKCNNNDCGALLDGVATLCCGVCESVSCSQDCFALYRRSCQLLPELMWTVYSWWK